MVLRSVVAVAVLVVGVACSPPGSPGSAPAEPAPPTPDPAAYLAHENYVEAINSNDLDRLLGMLTDDVVFMAPNDTPYVGKEALRPWLEGYLAAYTTHWDKPVEEFVVAGDWAFERYRYTSTDTPVSGGDPIVGTGWGFVVYHRDPDGVWRVARDAWGSDRPVAAE